MANEKISAMANAPALTGAEVVPLVLGGAPPNYHVTTGAIAALANGVSGGVLVGKFNLAGLNSVDINNVIDSTYDEYQICLMNLRLAAGNADVLLYTSADNGNTFASAAGNYSETTWNSAGLNTANVAAITLAHAASGVPANSAGLCGWVSLFQPCSDVLNYKGLNAFLTTDSAGGPGFPMIQTLQATRKNAAVVNALRIARQNAGTFASGEILVYGMRSTVTSSAGVRERLTAARTYYVSTAGNDNNNGLTAGTPFLTIQHAVNVAAFKLDLAGYPVTIQLAAGTYNEDVQLVPLVGASSNTPNNPTFVALTIVGDTAAPQNYVIAATAFACIQAYNFDGASIVSIKGVSLDATLGSYCVYASSYVSLRFENTNFVVAAGLVALLADSYTTFNLVGNCSVHGAAAEAFVECDYKSMILVGAVAFVDNTAFNTAIVSQSYGSLVDWGTPFTGVPTGPKYVLKYGSVLVNDTGNPLPGTVAGTVDSSSSVNGILGMNGNAVLVGGTVDVAVSNITATNLVMLSRKTSGGTDGNLTYTVTAGVKFTITSDNVLDTSTVSWMIF